MQNTVLDLTHTRCLYTDTCSFARVCVHMQPHHKIKAFMITVELLRCYSHTGKHGENKKMMHLFYKTDHDFNVIDSGLLSQSHFHFLYSCSQQL